MMAPSDGAEEALRFAVQLRFGDEKSGITEDAVGWNLLARASYGNKNDEFCITNDGFCI